MIKALFMAALLLFQGLPTSTVTGAIAGELRRQNGTSAAGMRVAALSVLDKASGEGAALISVAVTDERGRYRLVDLPQGRYYVIAGPLEAPVYFPGAPFRTGARAVEVAGGAWVSDINFQMVVAPPLAIRGRVVHGGVADLVSVSTRVALTGGLNSLTVDLGPDGSFAFLNLRPARYQLSIPGGRPVMGNVIDLVDQDVDGVEFTLPLTKVSGHVNAGVNALEFNRTDTPGFRSKVNVKSDGSFQLRILPGAYTLMSVSSDRVSPIPVPDVMVTVPDSTDLQLEIALPAVRRVTVRAAVEGGSVPPPFVLRIQGTVAEGRAVSAQPSGPSVFRSPAATVMGFAVDILPGSDGTFRVHLPEGHYEFGAGFPDDAPSPLRLKSITSSGLNAPADDAEIRVLFIR